MNRNHKLIFFGGVFTLISRFKFQRLLLFQQDFFVTWSPSHVNTSADGHESSLKLDQESGSGFASNQFFLFGQIDKQIKLITGHSAGTDVAFYLISNQPNRDEINIEFLGNVSGQPCILQTNIYADGFDSREERIYLSFDPTEDFHAHSILWNIYVSHLQMHDGAGQQ